MASGIALFLAQPTRAIAQDMARGVVFDDANRNLKRDAGEAGVPGVLVSNGREVVRTDTDGRYTLPIAGESIVFVTKPAGWAVPVDERQLPRFYYLHYPAGSRPGLDLEYPGIEPTGPLPASIDFPLHRHEEPNRFRMLALTDPQPSSDRELDYVRDDLVPELAGLEVAFGIVAGDIVGNKLELYPRYTEIMSKAGIPLWHLPGNHDMNFDAPEDRFSLETYKRTFGPPDYSFDYGNVHFVMLDNLIFDAERNNSFRPGFTDEQLAWLANDLELVPDDRLVVLAMHVPLKGNLANRDALFRLLATRPHVYTLAGHTHVNDHYYLGREDGFEGSKPLHHQVLAAGSGSWWSGPRDTRGIPVADQGDGVPNGYTVVTFDGNRYSARYKALHESADHQMRITFDQPEIENRRFTPSAEGLPQLVVNVFDGGQRSKVVYRVDDGPYVAMERTERADPFIAQLYARNPETLKRWLKVKESSHIWTAALPRDLAPGVYRVSVRTTDQFGQLFEASELFEVAPAKQ